MKLDQLRKVIREEVRAAVKEELQEMLNEAVKAASTPTQKPYTAQPTLAETLQTRTAPAERHPDPLMDILNQTRESMTSQEYNNVYAGSPNTVQKPNFASSMASNMGMMENAGPMPGLDITKFDFIKKAGAVYKASVEKDKQKFA